MQEASAILWKGARYIWICLFYIDDIAVRCFPSVVKMGAAFHTDVLVSAGSVDCCSRWYDIGQRADVKWVDCIYKAAAEEILKAHETKRDAQIKQNQDEPEGRDDREDSA